MPKRKIHSIALYQAGLPVSSEEIDRGFNDGIASSIERKNHLLDNYRFFIRGYLSAMQGSYSPQDINKMEKIVIDMVSKEGVPTTEHFADKYHQVFMQEFRARFERYSDKNQARLSI